MNVSQAIALLQLLPPDAVLVPSENPPCRHPKPGEVCDLRDPAVRPALNGFSAEELRLEEHEFFLLEDDIVVLAMTRNCLGQQV